MEPNDYPRRILLAVTGLSPQVVTETLYALAARQENPWIPTEVHLITTVEGAERVRVALLNPDHGHFYQLCRDYRLPDINFTMDKVHIFRDESGQPLPDIRSAADNRRCADFITETMREATADPESCLHVSIAGGRKTMGYYLGYALSLYGRSQDSLSHVLVSAPYESHPDFYYPTRESRLIHTRGDRPRAYDTREAQVSLAEIPFVRLRDGLPPSLMQGKANFSDTVTQAQRALGPTELMIDLENQRLSVSGVVIDNIAAGPLAFYSWMARRCSEALDPVRYDDNENLAGEFLDEYRQVVGEFGGDYDKARDSLKKGMGNENEGDDFHYRLSRANDMLKKNLPPQLFDRYRIAGFGKRPQTRYGLGLSADHIHWRTIAAPSGKNE